MFGLSGSECLLYGGIAIMAAAAIAAIACIIIFRITGRKIKRTLEREYGSKYFSGEGTVIGNVSNNSGYL